MKQVMHSKESKRPYEKNSALKQAPKTAWNKQWAQTSPKGPLKRSMHSNRTQGTYKTRYALQQDPRPHETSNALKQDPKSL